MLKSAGSLGLNNEEGGVMNHQLEQILNGKDKALHCVTSDVSVFDAVDIMCQAHVGALLVMRRGLPVGILSERDVMTRVVLTGKDPKETNVAAVMTKDVLCADGNTDPQNAMEIMTRRHFRHLPVISDGRVAGMVSIRDLVQWILRNRDEELRTLRDYVSGGYESYPESQVP
jgi:CBS domain-containing protein